mgnify:CR=1 FL=1|tara:strand:- start:398 stop:832 length:435 start_codon:yes stop_codon:yes gene_type:complete
MNWKAPKSPYTLLQEKLWQDPWKIFVCCIFCNLTKRLTAEPYFWEVLKRWPTPEDLAKADYNNLVKLIQPLGLSKKRAKALKKMSYDYLSKDWQGDATNLYGIGKYGSDAYRIFCKGEWKTVQPKDGALVNYVNWLRSNEYICS